MDEITLQQMQDYLSSLVDKLSAISSEAVVIKHTAGHKMAYLRTGNISVWDMTDNQQQCVDESQIIIDKMREILKGIK